MPMLRLLLVGLMLLCASAAYGLPADTWLVAIGNNFGDADEERLLYAERDAREVVDVLRRLGGVSTRRTLVLVDEEVTTVRQTLVDINAHIRAHAARTKRPTALLVFYSGHADAEALHLGGTHFDFGELRGIIEGSSADLRVLIVDACRSGGVSRVKGVQTAKTFDIKMEDQTAVEGVAIITSSAAGESSQESDRLQGSFFSHHLVNALRGAADRNRDGKVTLTEAYGYTYEQTIRSTGRTLEVQHPTYAYGIKGRGKVVLSEPAEQDRRSGRLQLPETHQYIISQGGQSGPLVAEVTPPQPNATVALPEARYFIQQRRPKEFREYAVNLVAGQTVNLADQPYTAVRYDRLVRRRGAPSRSVHGLKLLTGLRGETLPGQGFTPHLVLGYGADLPWLSLGVRLRGATTASDGADGLTPRRHDEFGLGISLERYIDLDWASLSFGVLLEGGWHRQVFTDDRASPDRQSASMGFGALFAAERHLWSGLALRFEGGPMSQVMRQSEVEDGEAQPPELASPLTWWFAGGVLWRL